MVMESFLAGTKPTKKISQEICVEHGGHCWVDSGMVLTSVPPQYPQHCKHCTATRIGTPQEEMSYRYPEGTVL